MSHMSVNSSLSGFELKEEGKEKGGVRTSGKEIGSGLTASP